MAENEELASASLSVDDVPPAPSLPPVGGWPRAIVLRVLALLIAGAALYRSQDGLGAVIVLFILVVPFERLFPVMSTKNSAVLTFPSMLVMRLPPHYCSLWD